MKILITVFTVISMLLWWEIPLLCFILSATNILIPLIKGEWTLYYKIMAGISVIAIVLCGWNWDLNVGMRIIEWFKNCG